MDAVVASTYMLNVALGSTREKISAILDYQQLEEARITVKRMKAMQIAREPKEREY